jgi:hypothetical protein
MARHLIWRGRPSLSRVASPSTIDRVVSGCLIQINFINPAASPRNPARSADPKVGGPHRNCPAYRCEFNTVPSEQATER